MTPPAEPKGLEEVSSIIALAPHASKSCPITPRPRARKPRSFVPRLFYILPFTLALAFSVPVFAYEHEQAPLMAQALAFDVVRKLR